MNVQKIFLNYRYYVLFVLCAVAIIGIGSVPYDTLPLGYWSFVLLMTKAGGFGAGYLFHRLFKRWEKRGTIKELVDFCNNY